MNQKEAQQLEKRIQREAPQYKTLLEYVTFVGGGNWGVNVVEKGTGHSIGIMESGEEWENVKQVLHCGVSKGDQLFYTHRFDAQHNPRFFEFQKLYYCV